MKRLLALTAFFSVLAEVTFAEEPQQPRFEVGTSLSVGNATELVLRNGTYDNPISRLVWDIPPSLAVDLSVEWPWNRWTSTALALGAAFPITSGTMVDEDWNTGSGSTDYSSARSQQIGYLATHWTVRAEQVFSPWENEFRIGVGLLYRWVSWEGWNGTGHYVQNNGAVTDATFSGLLISYQQQWFIPYLSCSWTWKQPGWELTPSVRLSPYTWCFDTDHHYYANSAAKTFLDNVRGGFYEQTGLEVAFPGGERWSLGIRATAEIAWGAVGDTTTVTNYVSTNGSTLPYGSSTSSAGAWFQEVNLMAFVRN